MIRKLNGLKAAGVAATMLFALPVARIAWLQRRWLGAFRGRPTPSLASRTAAVATA